MAQREFPGFTLRTGVTREGSRYTALVSSHPAAGGFPSYFAVYENRSFREEQAAADAAEKALGLILGVEEDGTPVFAEGETGFDDDRSPGEPAAARDDDESIDDASDHDTFGHDASA